MKKEYLVIKLGNVRGIDFYKEHQEVIRKYGYVDFAKTGIRRINFSLIKEPFFYIKESTSGKNRLFKAYINQGLGGEKRVPDYYSLFSIVDASWVRLTKLEIIDINKFLNSHSLINGNKIKALEKGAIPFFYVVNTEGNS